MFEGEVTSLQPVEAENSLAGYGKTITHVLIGLKTGKGNCQPLWCAVSPLVLFAVLFGVDTSRCCVVALGVCDAPFPVKERFLRACVSPHFRLFVSGSFLTRSLHFAGTKTLKLDPSIYESIQKVSATLCFPRCVCRLLP